MHTGDLCNGLAAQPEITFVETIVEAAARANNVVATEVRETSARTEARVPRTARPGRLVWHPPGQCEQQAQAQADAERAIASSQAANKNSAVAAARNTAAHPTAFVEKEPPKSVTAPRPAKTIPPAMRTPAQARRWRYSQGEIMRRRPDRGGDAHHPRRPFRAVLSLGAYMACLLWPSMSGHPGRLSK